MIVKFVIIEIITDDSLVDAFSYYYSAPTHTSSSSMTRISTTLSLSQSLSTSSPTQPPQPRRQGQQRSKQKQQVKKIVSQQQHLQRPSQHRQKQEQRRPYANLSIDELRQVTEYHLSQNINPDGTLSLGRTSPRQLHVFTRLVAAWSELLWWKDAMEENHSNSNSSSSGSNINDDNKSNGAILSSKQERIMAAEMAEQCLRELIEEEDARRLLLYMQQRQQTTIHDTATEIVTMITTPNLYHLVIRAWLHVVVDDNAVDGRYLRHATSLLDLMERRMMVPQSSSSSRTQLTIANEIETATAVAKPRTVSSKQRQQRDRIKCHELILNGWCKSKHNGAEIIAEEILHRLLSLITTTTTTTKVATADAKTTPMSMMNNNFGIVRRHYNNVINRIAASRKIDAGVHAERLLFELINLSSSSSLNGGKRGRGGPDRNTYNAVMKAYAKAHSSSSSSSSTSTRSGNSGNNNSNNNNNNDAIANIERILQMMDTQSKLHGNNNSDAQITPDKISYTILLTAYASSSNNDNDMGKKAEEILQHMTREYTVNGNMNLKPDTVTYNAVLNVWSKCQRRHVDDTDDATTKCMNLLNDMLRRYNDIGDTDIRPDDVTFNTVLHAIANDAYLGSSGSSSNDSNKKMLSADDDDDDDDDNSPPKRAVRLLEQMLLMGHQPDIITYNSVLNAFAKHGSVESARCAELMLNNLEELYDETKTLQQQQGKQESSRSLTSPSSWNICPDLYSYNIVISAWANCGQADKAVALLDRMSARTRDGKAMLIPDVTTYNTILHSWSQSLDRNAPVKALGLLEVMIRLHNNSNMQIGDDDDDDDDDDDLPSNTVTATSAVTTSQCILDVTSFSTVINSFAKSRYPRKARQARMLLTRLKSFNHGSGRAVGRMRRKNETLLRPNVYVYTAVLNACAYSYGSDKEEALRIGISTYEELQRSTELKTNHVAYGSFIRVCRKLMAENDSRRDNYITRAFKQCCLDGQLSEFVLRQLHPMPRLYNLLLKEYINDDNDDVRYTDLPSNWSAKVKDRTKQRRLSLDHYSKE